MFSNYVETKNNSLLDQYYAKDFILVSNRQTYNFQQFKALETAINKAIKSQTVLGYRDMLSSGNKVATRVAFNVVMKNGQSHTFHNILIARVNKDNKIDRMWEMTYPTWKNKI